MSEDTERDLDRWEAGNISLQELEAASTEDAAVELARLHSRLSSLATMPTPDPEESWQTLREQLPRITSRRVRERARRAVVLAMGAAALIGGVAFAADPVREVLTRAAAGLMGIFNNDPIAVAQPIRVREDTVTRWTPVVSDPDDDSLTCSLVESPDRATATLDSDCSTATFTPDTNYFGPDSFTYVVSDGTESAPATVSVDVTPVNDAPVVSPDAASTREDIPVVVTVLTTDSDVDGDALQPRVVAEPSKGSVAVGKDGRFTYTPAPNFSGRDSLTYVVSDGVEQSGRATVSVTVTSVNDAPVAEPDGATTEDDTPVAVAVLANDSDVDGDLLQPRVVGEPSSGSVAVGEEGTLTYTPAPNFSGADSFAYVVSDGAAESAPATVSVTVTSVNDAPVAEPDAATTEEEIPVAVAVLANDSDMEGDLLHPRVAGEPSNGSVTVGEDGVLTYTPAPDFSGTDWFAYVVSDGAVESAPATVSVTVTPVNEAPVALPEAITTKQDTATGWSPSVRDADGEELRCWIEVQPSHGRATVGAACSEGRYIPESGFTGTDTFSYTVSDGEAVASGTVSVVVLPADE
jgi:large repetitive protein